MQRTAVGRAAIVLIVLISCVARGAAAVGPAHQQDSNNPADLAQVYRDISDIEWLRRIGPLGLSAKQLRKLIGIISEEQKRYNAAMASLSIQPVRALADEIRSTKSAMVRGAEIPARFDAK